MNESAVALALLGAVAYGVCDFIGGIGSRRSSPWPVALLTSVGVIVVTLVVAPFAGGHPKPSDFLFAGIAGIGSGAGSAFFYRGLTTGAMSVVAPITAAGSTLVPVAAGAIFGGRQPELLAWIGIALALPGVWLISGGTVHTSFRAPGVRDAIIAGLSWGSMLAAIGVIGRTSGLWPILTAQPVAVLTTIVLAAVFGASAIPRTRDSWLGLVAGILAGIAQAAFVFSARNGPLSVSAVLVSLYPAVTVLLAIGLLRERLHRTQLAGLALSATSVVLVALG